MEVNSLSQTPGWVGCARGVVGQSFPLQPDGIRGQEANSGTHRSRGDLTFGSFSRGDEPSLLQWGGKSSIQLLLEHVRVVGTVLRAGGVPTLQSPCSAAAPQP